MQSENSAYKRASHRVGVLTELLASRNQTSQQVWGNDTSGQMLQMNGLLLCIQYDSCLKSSCNDSVKDCH